MKYIKYFNSILDLINCELLDTPIVVSYNSVDSSNNLILVKNDYSSDNDDYVTFTLDSSNNVGVNNFVSPEITIKYIE